MARCRVFYRGFTLVAWCSLVTVAAGEEAGWQALSIVLPFKCFRLRDAR